MAAPRDVDPLTGEPRASLDDAPPILSWPKIYGLVLGALALQIVIYAALTAVMR